MSRVARLEILTRINRARGAVGGPLERAPVRPSVRVRWDIVEQFAEYAAEYRANVVRVSQAQLAASVAGLMAQRTGRRVAVPEGLPAAWLPAGLAALRDEQGVTDLTAVDTVITGCAAAVAETGTVILDHGPAQGRRALTLVPDHHICVVSEAQVVDSFPEVMVRLQESVRRGQPLTWISGPSATSDIELSRVEGVHGPRVLDILLVQDASDWREVGGSTRSEARSPD